MSLFLILSVLHVIGAVVGAGGATTSDALFMRSIRNRVISTDQYQLLKAASRLVLTGIGVLVLTGIALLLYDTELIERTHFQAKMTAVFVLLFNAMAMHIWVFRFFKEHRDTQLSDESIRSRMALFAGTGATSVVSWYGALVLALIGPLEVSYWLLLLIYVALIVSGTVVAYMVLSRVLFPPHGPAEEAESTTIPGWIIAHIPVITLSVLLVLLVVGLAFASWRA